MIPHSEESWTSSPTSTAISVSSTVTNQLLHLYNVPEKKHLTAWKRYRYLVKTMESSGQKFNKKLMLEAIFRGNDLVYSASTKCNVS